jgi:hypothetical protein
MAGDAELGRGDRLHETKSLLPSCLHHFRVADLERIFAGGLAFFELVQNAKLPGVGLIGRVSELETGASDVSACLFGQLPGNGGRPFLANLYGFHRAALFNPRKGS